MKIKPLIISGKKSKNTCKSLKKKKKAKLSSCKDHIREPEKAEEEESSLGRTQKLPAVPEGEEHSVKGRK